jgi:ATP phosphoribosyltransferase regulatory subunit HisZ
MLSELAAVCDADDESSSNRLQELLAAISREEEVQKREAQVHIEAARKSAQEAKALSDAAKQAAAAALSAAKVSEVVRFSIPTLAVFFQFIFLNFTLSKQTSHSLKSHVYRRVK